MIKTIKDLNATQLKDKKVLVRVDFNVPLDKNMNITDDTRIQAALPTIKYLISKQAKVILVSHLGRPKGKVVEELRLSPIAAYLTNLLGINVKKTNTSIGAEAQQACEQLLGGGVLMLENIRFHAEEEANDQNFCKELAKLADIFVNDAFGTAHRAHASTTGVASYLNPAVAGFLMSKELEMLGESLDNPQRPFTAIVGGSKISSKISVLNSLIKKVDTLIIGGGMAYTFLKSRGASIGQSICEHDQLDRAREISALADENGTAILLPTDVVATAARDLAGNPISVFEDYQPDDTFGTKVLAADQIPDDWQGMDIGHATRIEYAKVISQSKTVLWNGPMGVFEYKMFESGTREVAEALQLLTKAGGNTIIGGGDSVASIEKFKMSKADFTHVSTGGGASLEFLEGKILPGVDCLDQKADSAKDSKDDEASSKSFAEELDNLASQS
jgi:phosphoglycerate kinase